ncbi:Putative Origin recognition complex subunit 2 [[Torrubiella] hemipterigena]|uniref:Origin recognition complex subunit 2 n=1 Tax=[Torrubiella] hemipterigena TaxID=1531966 RepID=A0A0A1T641_9HYPO|nr:Putative Origin recognition complex subunit 2 [[Torrubiella] hemipterigena]
MDEAMDSDITGRNTPDTDTMDTDSPSRQFASNGATESNHELSMNGANGVSHEVPDEPVMTTPTPKRRGRPPKNASRQSIPSKAKKLALFETPTKPNGAGMATPQKQAADRSAMRKTVRTLIEQATLDGASDDEQDDDLVARELYGDSDGDDTEMMDDGTSVGDGRSDIGTADELATPSKAPQRRKRRQRARSPTPPRDLPAHEMYFLHNKPGRPKTSDNTLASLTLLAHDEYFEIMKTYQDPHGADIEYLETLHAESFPQWLFELTQGYSLCLYGFGSKRKLLKKFATHIYERNKISGNGDIVMVNGYAPTTTIRDILTCVSTAVDPSRKASTAQPSIMAQSILSHLSETPNKTVTIVVNSIDGAPLRKGTTQGVLAKLAAHPQIHFICSADSPDFTLLWDIGHRSAFNFTFHDCTTFAPMLAEIDAVDEVHELLGRQARRINGREGVAFVLKSLPDNAKNLFQLLVGEVLVVMGDTGETNGEEGAGVEYRAMYNKSVEEFICTSEMAFRTLLKEFHDHQIITSKKDAVGTEMLSLPFSMEDLEAIYEDLAG